MSYGLNLKNQTQATRAWEHIRGGIDIEHKYDKYGYIKTHFGDSLKVVCVPKDLVENTIYLSCNGLEKRLIAKDILHQITLQLTEHQNMIMYWHYTKHFSMKLIGNLIGVSEQRISQIHSKTIEGIRQKWTAG